MAQLDNQHQAKLDETYMARALEVARAGLGWTSPNPMVGCVLVRDGQLIGQGAHLRDGEQHAEVQALTDAGDASGATAYVTLEPCTHTGRQPACCDALIRAGVIRVVYAIEDLDSRTAGVARPILEAAGIVVASGAMAEKCRRFLDYYLHARLKQRVFVHLKMALSLDAKLACKTGHSQWLSGPESLGYAHYLRQKYDAVLVGSGTVQTDNPRLTARKETMAPYFKLPTHTPVRNPVRVILDSAFTVEQHESQNFLSTSGDAWRNSLPRVIFAGNAENLPQSSSRHVESEIINLGLSTNDAGRLDLTELLQKLWGLGIHSLLVEGGSKVSQEFIRQSKIDKCSLVYTPRIIGSDGLGFSPEMGVESVNEALSLEDVASKTLGSDVVISGYFQPNTPN